MKTKAKIFIIKTLDFILKIWYNINVKIKGGDLH